MARHVPSFIRKLISTNISPKFREVTKIVEEPLQALQPGEVLVKNRYLGINASDINYTAGRYDPTLKPPFDIGFEAVGEVVSVGKDVQSLCPGQPVMYCKYGAFRDYIKLNAKRLIKLPAVDAKYLSFTLSGPTAGIALDKMGDLKKGETVLVTAAAGGTGQFAVQWAKLAGCYVIGTCSSDKKVEFLKDIGCDRPVNYKKEELKKVLHQEYKDGVDVVYESVGGEMFDTCVNSLKSKGRLIIIGFISGYQTDLGFQPSRTMATLPVRNNYRRPEDIKENGVPSDGFGQGHRPWSKLVQKSASVRGFFLPHYDKEWFQYAAKMSEMCYNGKLKSYVDTGEETNKGPFVGLDQVPDAVEYLYTMTSVGKIVVELKDSDIPSKL